METDGFSVMARRPIVLAIERLEISADAKVLLLKLADVTVTVGRQVHAIGRQILSFAFEAVKRYPNTSFGIVVGLVLTMLVGSIALIGAALSALLGPLLIALGLGIGAVADIQSQPLRDRVAAFETHTRATLGG